MRTSLSAHLSNRLTYTPQNSGREASVLTVSHILTTYEQRFLLITTGRPVLFLANQ